MTPEELRRLVSPVVEEKLAELLRDPDAGLELRGDVRQRLLLQRQAVADGERGEPLSEVVPRILPS
jgi:hypothetical protein